MRTRSQRLLSMVLALSMLLTFLPLSAFAEGTPPPYTDPQALNDDNDDNTYKDNEYTYTLNSDGTATLTKFTGTVANVPETVTKDDKTYTVTAIGADAFAKTKTVFNKKDQTYHLVYEKNDQLTSVKLPDTITDIGDHAFANCKTLSSLTTQGQTTSIPNGITTINDGTFAYCEELNDFNFPDSVTSIGDSAFTECHAFTNITLPDHLKTIGSGAFFYCKKLESVKIPVSVSEVKAGAFFDPYTPSSTPSSTFKTFSKVYYTGTQAQWNKLINSEDGNSFALDSNTELTDVAPANFYCAHTVTFNVGGHGIAPDEQVVQYEGCAEKPSDPTEKGYTFKYWFATSEDGEEKEFNFNTKIIDDTELFAHWEEVKKPTTPEQPTPPQQPSQPGTQQPGTTTPTTPPESTDKPSTPEKPNEPSTPEKPNEPNPPEAPAVEEDDTAAMGYAAAAVTAAFVGWGAYRIGSEVYLKYLLPNDVLLPQNRIQLAELLWEDAGRPAPAEAAAYTDVDDTDAQQAARWAVENGLLTLPDTEKPEEFVPYRSVSYAKSARAWNQAQQLKENAAAR